MFFQALSRAVDIGANSYLLDLDGARIVLDAGMHPKYEGEESLPDFDQIGYDSTDAIIVTHAHLDHAGALPVLVRNQPNAVVYMSPETLHLAEAMLHNSVNVMCSKREELGLLDYPFFTHKELDRLQPFWEPRTPGRRFDLNADGMATCEFFCAGHVLGAVGARIEAGGRKIFYTGDVHFEPQTLSLGGDFPDDPVDVLIIETTRGDFERAPDYSREAEKQRFGARIRTCLERGGSVMIPVFALGKTQEVLLMLHELKESGDIPDAPLHIGGLSTKMTIIYDNFASTSRRKHRHFRILEDMDLVRSSRRQRGEIPYHPGRIYALSSGMMTEKTVSYGFARNILPDSRNALLFVGYADPASPAGQILAAEPGTPIFLGEDAPAVPLRCEVDKFDFSGHATRDALLGYIRRVKPKHVILVHGDEAARGWFRAQLANDMPDVKVTIPHPGEKIDLG